MKQGISLPIAFLILVVAVSAASYPALTGSWIYDDVKMARHPLMDGWDDVTPVFSRTSADYFHREGQEPEPNLGGVTYRPLPLASLVAVNAALGPAAAAHHIVSLLLHLATILLLLRLVSPGWRRPVPWEGGALIAVFALHPAMGEAYMWINGRSDVLAGLALAGLALLLFSRRGKSGGVGSFVLRGAGFFAVALLGALSKETFVPAAAVLVIASISSKRGAGANGSFRGRLRRQGPALAGIVIAFMVVFLLRQGALPGDVPAVLGASFRVTWEYLTRVPKLLGLAAETLLVPFPRPMRNLGFELAQGLGPVQIMGNLVVAGAIVALALRRRFVEAWLVLGAAIMLAPAVYVADIFWLGFDRYLYLPAILIVAAAAPLVAEAGMELQERGLLRRLVSAGVVVLLLLLAAASWRSATFFKSNEAFSRAIMTQRPDDPTGYLLVTQEIMKSRGDAVGAVAVLKSMPAKKLPPPLAHETARTAHALGQPGIVIAVLEDAFKRYPQNPFVRFDLLGLRGAQGRFREAFALANGLLSAPGFCEATKQVIGQWLESGKLPQKPQETFEKMWKRARCR